MVRIWQTDDPIANGVGGGGPQEAAESVVTRIALAAARVPPAVPTVATAVAVAVPAGATLTVVCATGTGSCEIAVLCGAAADGAELPGGQGPSDRFHQGGHQPVEDEIVTADQ